MWLVGRTDALIDLVESVRSTDLETPKVQTRQLIWHCGIT